MTTFTSSVSPKGQVTIPVEIRKELGISPQDVVVFEIDNGEVRLATLRSQLMDIYQSVPPLATPRSWKEIEAIAHEDHIEHVVLEGREDDSGAM